jgi:hypothetical protein
MAALAPAASVLVILALALAASALAPVVSAVPFIVLHG